MEDFEGKINLLNDLLCRYNRIVAPPCCEISQKVYRLQNMMKDLVLSNEYDNDAVEALLGSLGVLEAHEADLWRNYTIQRTIENTTNKPYRKYIKKILGKKKVSRLEVMKCLISFLTHVLIEEEKTQVASDVVGYLLEEMKIAYSSRDTKSLEKLVFKLFCV